jgi:NAD(P)-dependent dehydrogenase (short-subunit alcohol dehydrogenase family)
VLNSKLKALLTNRDGDAAPQEGRFIINVSAMEGQFYRFKSVTHPHTNMAKAALNMMTRTSAEDYAKDGIYMNSVDTGWITDESPLQKREERRRSSGEMLCPLDEVDAAARCLDLIYTDSREYGKFWKDFHVIQW